MFTHGVGSGVYSNVSATFIIEKYTKETEKMQRKFGSDAESLYLCRRIVKRINICRNDKNNKYYAQRSRNLSGGGIDSPTNGVW